MEKELYESANSILELDNEGSNNNADNSNNNSLLLLCWRGEIKLWKAIVFVDIIGMTAIVWIVYFSLLILMGFFGSEFLGKLYYLTTIVGYGTFSVVCVWRAASKSSSSTKNILGKLWALFYALQVLNLISKVGF